VPVSEVTKHCRRCDRVLEARFFYRRVLESGKVTLASPCMPCRAARKKQRIECNKERQLQSAPTQQTCRQCNQLLPIEAYFVSHAARPGFEAVCRECANAEGAKLRHARGALFNQMGQRIPAPSHKLCNSCDHVKPIDDFVRNSYTPTGYKHICKACRAVEVRRWALRRGLSAD
jgi:hypothetical protein